MFIDEESNCQLLCSKSRDALDDTETRTECMSSFVEAYSQGHISFKDAVGVRAVMVTDSLYKRFHRGGKTARAGPVQRFPVEACPIRVQPSRYVISRGLDVKELATNDLWWKGPDLQNITVATPDSLQVSSTVTHQCYTNGLKPMHLK
ncbi:integrase catalytic domain-containing protein [Trichonephila inaurata madagascariensis]|uniref:Integrase catalytic domain-containing protein n=1 Tax=Trichonephila inaurata madagascariensis TaxID=2747483 RepID=A0A8X6YRH2_9ARAC|nr:integrase catalytic domain-containing protein [Trichonephila inaurata madagascariensis]